MFHFHSRRTKNLSGKSSLVFSFLFSFSLEPLKLRTIKACCVNVREHPFKPSAVPYSLSISFSSTHPWRKRLWLMFRVNVLSLSVQGVLWLFLNQLVLMQLENLYFRHWRYFLVFLIDTLIFFSDFFLILDNFILGSYFNCLLLCDINRLFW